jgi:hypothetical protein
MPTTGILACPHFFYFGDALSRVYLPHFDAGLSSFHNPPGLYMACSRSTRLLSTALPSTIKT